MKKKIYEKMNQLDRIEYGLESEKNNPSLSVAFIVLIMYTLFAIFVAINGLITKDVKMIDNGYIVLGAGAIQFAILSLINLIIPAILQPRTDKKYLERLEIKSKK